jgi:hypothetical protein
MTFRVMHNIKVKKVIPQYGGLCLPKKAEFYVYFENITYLNE